MVLIGLTTDYESSGEFRTRIKGVGRYTLRESYTGAVEKAGGVPVMLPFVENPSACLDYLDGLIVTGGNFDLPPEISGIPDPSKARRVKPDRTRFERGLLEAALERDIPVLGICGGMQLLAVLAGGRLVGEISEEVPDAFDHEQKIPPTEPRHPVKLVPGTILHRLALKEKIGVNSTHHQAVADPGRCTVSAWSIDGIIEAIEWPGKYWAVGVEWHPELLADRHESHAAIFRGFVRACSDRNRPAV